MKEIVETLVIAIVLVILVVYLFLQGWRATLIPLLAVPVSLIGTFVFFPLFGFSINTLSLFGLVLAIGLVVDDAIVVVEAVERHIEEGLAPKDAALKAMEEISGPVIGIALVLSAVFVPTAFIPGITGRLYQQFAVTIAISVILSAFNALTLSPALAALLLKPQDGKPAGCCAGSSTGSTACSAAPPTATSRWSGALIRKSAVAFAAAGGLRRRGRLLQRQSCPPAFCRTRIRATSTSTCSFPTPPRCSARRGCRAEGRGDPGQDAGRRVHHQRRRLQPAELRADQLQRVLLRHAEGLGRPQDAGRAVSGHQAAPEPEAQQASATASPSLSRRPRFPASAPPAASPSCWRTAPARTCSSWPTT